MVITDTVEGVINGTLWFHYDLSNDVLYLRLCGKRETTAVGEETSEGFILLHDADSNEPIGLTVVNWWKRFGQGKRPDSIVKLQQYIEPWAEKVAA